MLGGPQVRSIHGTHTELNKSKYNLHSALTPGSGTYMKPQCLFRKWLVWGSKSTSAIRADLDKHVLKQALPHLQTTRHNSSYT